MTYEDQVRAELAVWKREMTKRSGPFQRIANTVQTKVNSLIPEKAHEIITESIKKVVQAALFGAEYTTKKRYEHRRTLEQIDRQVLDAVNVYKKVAAAEGAGTGAGGILLGLADFPLLLGIKMRFLFEAASIYGFDTDLYEERLYILHVFQLAFSNDEHRIKMLYILEHWDERKSELVNMDWKVFQQQYRDYIDFVKMLQLVPGIGAVVGAYANYNLLEHLGKVTMNSYRMRVLGGIV
ncbi:EcsC family protein [Paenibacillus alkalitolerans]|uniref:EcsC family protein n=1 Tax=Paenibacillus alkalitolerans TaxID=2799335 RepID=UPI0018F48C6B|nr:EcsC family protein [Paenibacillus alkalitolerans]